MALRVHDVSYALPARPLLRQVSLEVPDGKRVGLIGRNGSGKTTLLRVITGELRPDEGSIERTPPALRVGYLPQGALDTASGTVATLLGQAGGAWAAAQEVARIGDAFAEPGADVERLVCELGDAQARLEQAGGNPQAQATHAILAGLGLAEIAADRSIQQLSGGQRTRLGLARLLLEAPDLLIMDEPTNHLDLAGLLWLEAFLQRFRGGVLLVSHDRVFLDRVVQSIVALEDGTARTYSGGYGAYAATARAEEAEQWQTYRRQERVKERLEEQIRHEQERARRTENATTDFAPRAKAKKGARQAKVKERRLERMLAAGDWADKPRPEWEVKLDFGHVPPGSRQALVAEGLRQSFGARTILNGVDLLVRTGERIVLTGPNGSGKSTLLKALAGRFAPDAGAVRLGESTRLGYLGQDQEEVPATETPLALVRAAAPLDETAARGYLHFFLFSGDQAFTPVGRLSNGERARLNLALVLLSGANFLALDEPLNHLDIPARERLEQAILQFPGTCLVVAHDRAFIRNVATRILELRHGRLHEYPDTERWETGTEAGVGDGRRA